MGRIGSYIAYILAVFIGYWLMFKFSAPLSALLMPLLGDNAMLVAIVALMVSPFLAAFVALRLID
jgi:hypothetical protein